MKNNKEYGNLTLTVRLGESIIVGDSLVTLTQIKRKEVRITFNAPKTTNIQRTNRKTDALAKKII